MVSQMDHTISPIDHADTENITRMVDFPSMQEGPLYRLMFPSWADTTEAQKEEIIQWYAEGLRDALEHKTESFLQVCTADGVPLGFCGWRIERSGSEASDARGTGSRQAPLPETLDLSAWLGISADLRKERERVLKGIDDVCREWPQQYPPSTTHISH